MKSKYSESGIVHVFLLVIILVAMGAAGYLAYQNMRKSSSLSTYPSPSAPLNSDSFTVTEWDVRFTLVSSLKSTKVVQLSGNDGTNGTFYAFTTARIQALGGKCIGSPFGNTVTLSRFAEKPIATPDGELLSSTSINGYYYVLSGPIASCSGFDSNGQMHAPSQIELNDRQALKDSVRTLSSTHSPSNVSSITPSGGTPLQFILPSGWIIDGNNLTSTIDGVGYRIGFQITDTDYLKHNYGGDASLIEKVKTHLDTEVFIIKSQGDVDLSGCLPSGGYGCSLKQNGHFLFISLYPYKPGDQSVQPIDFNSTSAPKAIQGLTSITKSLRL